MTRWTLRILLMLILGVVTTVVVAWALAMQSSWGASSVHSTRIGDNRWRNRLTTVGPGVTVHGVWDGNVHVDAELTLHVLGSGTDRRTVVEAGWPERALSCRYLDFVAVYGPNGSAAIPNQLINVETGIFLFKKAPHRPVSLPVRPILPGFIINTLLYAAIWFVLFFGFGALRRTIRRKRGRCPRCGYDLRGALLPSPSGRGAGGEGQQGCPECGWNRAEVNT